MVCYSSRILVVAYINFIPGALALRRHQQILRVIQLPYQFMDQLACSHPHFCPICFMMIPVIIYVFSNPFILSLTCTLFAIQAVLRLGVVNYLRDTKQDQHTKRPCDIQNLELAKISTLFQKSGHQTIFSHPIANSFFL